MGWNTGIDSVNIQMPYRYWEKMAVECERQCDREISWPCRICRAWAAQCAKMFWCLACGAGIWQQLLWVGIVVGRWAIILYVFNLQSAPNRNHYDLIETWDDLRCKHLLFLFSPWHRIHQFLWCTCNVAFTSKDFKTSIACKAGIVWDYKLILWFVRVPPLFMLARIHSRCLKQAGFLQSLQDCSSCSKWVCSSERGNANLT